MACVGQNVSAPQPAPAHRRPVWKPLAAAAVFVLLIGGIFGYRALDRSVCTVIVDINPSVTLTVNRLGRVKAMDTGNADADALLADIDLAGARTQDALDTLTDARTDADAWQVSPGKAALAETIALQTQLDTAQALSALPVQDLLVLAETYEVTFDTAQPAQTPDTPATPGKPGDSAAPAGSEISISEALSRVLQELGISLPDIRDVNVQRVQVSGRDAYHITFTENGKPYSFYADTHDGDLF